MQVAVAMLILDSQRKCIFAASEIMLRKKQNIAAQM